MRMKLKRLIQEIPVEKVWGSKEIEISGISANSKGISPGNLFIAKKGRRHHGSLFLSEAVQAGAAAVLTDMYDPNFPHIVQIIHPDVASIEGLIAARFYDFPSDDLLMIGITGTNGKTTTSYLVKHLLDKTGGSCGLIGTIEHLIGNHRYQPTHTTPDVATNHKLLHEMVLQECKAAVMEVTSHALDQKRVALIDFDIAVFTNLTLEHLDYHGTMEKYCAAKSRLFRSLSLSNEGKKSGFPKAAIVNVDDPWQNKIIEGCQVPVLKYGIDQPCDVQASNIKLNSRGSSFDLLFQGSTTHFSWPLVGRFNIYNALAAIGVGIISGVPVDQIAQVMKSFPAVPGRLQPVPNSLGLKIYVDFAHTDDALKNVLKSLSEFKKGRVITVFGGGGDRDRSKRPKMGKVADEFSDECIVTSDNPRSEDPMEICKEIAAGFTRKPLIELDRYVAIKQAIDMAKEDDIVLIAGKGHEKFQIFAHRTIEFDDCQVAAEICTKKG